MAPVFAQSLSDRTGLSTSFGVQVNGNTFVIQSVANFDIQDIKFENDRLVLAINSSLENNLGELQIPQNVTRGQIKFYLDGSEMSPKVLQNEKITFVTLEFVGNGTHTIEIASDVSATKVPPEPTSDIKFDQIVAVIAIVGIVIAVGVGSTIAFYVKRKSKSQ